jgi:hypothetical protein
VVPPAIPAAVALVALELRILYITWITRHGLGADTGFALIKWGLPNDDQIESL